MALEVWVKGYRQASPLLTSPPTGWADGLKLPQLVVRTCFQEAVYRMETCGVTVNMFTHSRGALEPACGAPRSSYARLSLTSCSRPTDSLESANGAFKSQTLQIGAFSFSGKPVVKH